MPEPTTQQERDLFAAWVTQEWPGYLAPGTDETRAFPKEWKAWQAARSLPPTDAPRVRELEDALQNVVNVYGTDSPMWNQARAALARHEGGSNG